MAKKIKQILILPKAEIKAKKKKRRKSKGLRATIALFAATEQSD